MKHPKVTVVFQPAGATPADAKTAANQQVFIDLTPGTMTAAQTNALGVLVTPAPGNKQIELDDSRTYQVVLTATKGGAAPPASSGAKVSVSAGKLIVPPQIAIKVTGITAPLACSLTVGTNKTSVTTTPGGWVTSNDTSSGVVTLSSATKLIKVKGAADPAVTLTFPAKITRGDNVKFTVNPPATLVDFKVTEWVYVASHSNPGAKTAATATIKRPATETTATFNQFWEGIMCASGSLSAHFVCGASLRTSGSSAVAAEVTASAPLIQAADISVEARAWTTDLVKNAEAPLNKAIASAHDTGEHKWNMSDPLLTPKTVASGPNRGATFAESATVKFTSSPFINANLTNAASAFSLAQGSAHLTTPRVATIPAKFCGPGTNGGITVTDQPGLIAHFSLTGAFTFLDGITHAQLLAGTKRHEYDHPKEMSHKGNCLKALRALEPRTFIEPHVGLPGGAPVNLTNLFKARTDAVFSVAPTHNIVDESDTKTAGAIRFTKGASIPVINADTGGTVIGTVWNPATNQPLP